MEYFNNAQEEFGSIVPRLAKGNFLTRIFTAPGTHQANNQQARNQRVAGAAQDLYSQYADYLKGMSPEMQQAYTHIFNMATNPNYAAMVAKMHSELPINAMAAQHGAMNMYGNGALAQGAGISAMNKGMDTANQYGAQQYDPRSIMGNMGAGLSAMQTPLNNMTQLGGLVYGQPQVPVGKSGLDYLAQAAGMYSASKTGGMGGGGGGIAPAQGADTGGQDIGNHFLGM